MNNFRNSTDKLVTLEETQTIVEHVVTSVRQAVVATMGPNGKLSAIGSGSAVKITKDGVTVAKSIRFEDPRAEVVNRIITEAAIKTDHECGDGTTTTIQITAALYELFSKYPKYRDQVFIEKTVMQIVDELSKASIRMDLNDPVLYQLALTSSNQDHELSSIVTQIYRESSGTFPEIELKEAQYGKDKVFRTNGIPLKMHFSNPGFSATGNGMETDFTGFLPIIVDTTLVLNDSSLKTLAYINDVVRDTTVIFIARSAAHEFNNMLFGLNNIKIGQAEYGNNKFIAINTNAGGSVGTLMMQDLSTMLSCNLYTSLEDVPKIELPDEFKSGILSVGSVRAVLKDITPELRVKLNERADEIQDELDAYELGDRMSLRARFNENRIRQLRAELVTVFVGGETYSDVRERMDRFEDVVKAVKSGLMNGILPGAGTAIIDAARTVFTEMLKEKKITPVWEDLYRLIPVQYTYLINQTDDVELIDHVNTRIPSKDDIEGVINVSMEVFCTDVEGYLPVMDLATGEVGSAFQLGIYDTAYAAITALKGGLQTAKILANTRSILLGEKINSIPVR